MTTDAADRRPRANLVISGRTPTALITPVTIGRDPRTGDGEVLVVDDDPLVSKSHLLIDRDADGFVVMDLGSSNGTFVHHAGSESVVPTDSQVPIPPGAEVEFGDHRLTIEVEAVPAPPISDESATPQYGIVAPVAPVAPIDPWGAGERTPGRDAPEPHAPETGAADQVGGGSIECANCRRRLAPGSMFCDGCGRPTGSTGSPPSAPAPPDPNATVVVPAAALAASAASPAAVGPAGPPAPSGSVPPPGSPLPPGSPAPYGIPVAGAPFDAGRPGGPVFVDPDSTPDSSGGRWKVVVGAIGAIVVLGLVGVLIAGALGGDDSSANTDALTSVPESVDELWSEPVSDAVDAHVDGDRVYVVTLDFETDRVDVIGLERSTGDELWDASVETTGLFADVEGGVPGVIVVSVCDDECFAIGLDPETGDELWSERVGDGIVQVTGGFVYSIGEGDVEFFDPLTGDRIERVRGSDVRVGDGWVAIADGEDVEVFDSDLDSILGPEAIDRADAFAFDGDRLIIAEGDELRFVDVDGAVVKESSVDVGLIDGLDPVADDNVVLSSDEGVISVDPVDGTADERWSERGEIVSVADVEGGTVVLVEEGDNVDVIDADSGDRRFGEEVDSPDGGFAFPGSNLFVVYRFDSFDEPTDVTAFDWVTGDEVWDERFDGFPIIDGGLALEVTIDGDVVVYG